MDKNRVSKIIASALVIVLAAAGVYYFYYYKAMAVSASQIEEIKTLTARKQDIKIGISADGKSSYSVVNLRFNTSGILSKVFVSEGQKVKKGDMLAKLDENNLQYQIRQAEANYNSAIAKLERIKSGTSPAEIQSRQVAVDNALRALNAAQQYYNYKSSLDVDGNLNSQLDKAQQNYNAAVRNYNQLNSKIEEKQDIVDRANYDLTVAQQYYTSRVIDFSQGKLSDAEIKTESEKLQSVKDRLAKAETELYALQTALSYDLYNAEQLVKDTYSTLYTAINDLKKTGLSGGELINEKSKVESAKAQLETAKAQLELAKLPVDPNDIKTAEEAVNIAKASLDMARNNLNETVLKAPIDGTVFLVNGKVGELVSSNSGASGFIILADTNHISVEANILEDDIGKIKIGQETEITFNAIQDEVFKGKISYISLNPIVDQSGIVTYSANISVENKNDSIKNGMTASMLFIIEQAKGVVTIPNETVKRVDNSPSVEIQGKDGAITWQKIKTGLTDGVNVEVKEGLKEWDKVIVRKAVKK